MLTPTCLHCGQAQLEYEDTIDQYFDYEGGILTEFTVAHCPQCRHDFSYRNVFQMTFTGFADIQDITEDEKEEECGDCDSNLEEEEPVLSDAVTADGTGEKMMKSTLAVTTPMMVLLPPANMTIKENYKW